MKATMPSRRTHYENFPVASVLLPPAMRVHIAAVYAFARTADDFADEGDRSPDERCRLLDGWLARLRDAAVMNADDRPLREGEPPDTAALFRALGRTIREKSLPVALFEDLLSAFRQDVTVSRYDSWDQLLDYCRRSANPVGRIVLRIAGHNDARFDRWSDSICTALQLTNFWQDLRIDAGRGRLYVPLVDTIRHGAAVADLEAGRSTAAWQQVLRELTGRTRMLFNDGRPLCDEAGGRLRYELRATWLGGVRILDRLEAVNFDVMARRPVIAAGDVPWFLWRMTTWRSGSVAGRAPASDTARPSAPRNS